MSGDIKAIPRRRASEWVFKSQKVYRNPFADVALDATFVGPSGQTITVPGFYDGDATWRVRFSPNQVGRWTYTTTARPADLDLEIEGAFEVLENETRGYLTATPGQAWCFAYESGEPVFLLGDTVYNLFGMAHCGGDVEGFLRRRAQQGFNLFRVRLPVSPYHPPEAYSEWEPGCRPPVWATEARDVVAVYLPALGAVCPTLPADRAYDAQWYDPCTGECFSAEGDAEDGWLEFIAPLTFEDGHPRDGVLVLHERTYR